MKVALYGATGASGSRILTELVSRGHQVTAIVRDPSKFPNLGPGVVVKQDDLSDPKKIAAAINGAEVTISAYAPPQDAEGHMKISVSRSQLGNDGRASRDTLTANWRRHL